MESPNAISFFVVIFMKGASRIKFQVRRQVTFLNITERCRSQLSHFNDRGGLDRYCPSIVHLPTSRFHGLVNRMFAGPCRNSMQPCVYLQYSQTLTMRDEDYKIMSFRHQLHEL